ncbi:TRAP transporter substrate-binding protein DctP [Halomonas urumqiensis]|uniref:C4-dicarboxylate ABC transporter substrate-binding protein n=1 Tax=Halomonas urumqiensis TaxID=1684789 RepID=A0A2N7UML7_9GAMM|nr:TRAP transporter substrate-binding protein DctP [Halomonas urumqiensis]PMR81649.1 C4-dicarboxylate ABC transporter substrate-binding protein [Halomonas urumqiensis]PTB02286.1 C4-dicarboxylate ABC transporter substrate-binding protein [Halomonas urumqiensis]GHE21754.1 C4-dicarboxylate ABC transporter substrate-binding protein [Halomonas urumqiensis]
MNKSLITSLGIATLLASGQAMALDRISAVHAFPTSLIYTKSFLEFVDKVNERGDGVVQIDVRGGPEVIGLSEQPDAVRNGVVDMAYTAASFYAGTVPERDAMVASNTNAIFARENGGIDLLNEIHQEKMGTYYLGWFDSGVSYNLYTIEEPEIDEDGNLSVSGLTLRSNPVYDAFFQDYLGAQPISLPTTDVYSALERSVVNATGWTQIGLKDLNWDRFLNYRIDPAFFSTDMGVIVNLDSWNQLSEESREILQEVAIEHERDSAEQLAELAKEQQQELEDDGMQVFRLEGEAGATFSEAAREATWERMRGQMERHPMGLDHYDALIEKFNDL